MADATDNLVEAEKIIKDIMVGRLADKALEICRWLLSFNSQENHKIKCYQTGGKRPDIRFCIDRGSDCEHTKITTGFLVIEPDHALMGLYSSSPRRYTYFKPDTNTRWRIGSRDMSEPPITTIREHILESYCLKIKDLGLDSVVCNLNDSVSRPKWPPNQYPIGSYLPTKEDFDTACRSLAKPSQEVSIDAVLDQIEHNAKKSGLNLRDNWRISTERSIEIWSK
jgi:hypothetical protein